MRITQLKVGALLPTREHCPTNVSLFLYNAAVWNAHRIHYDAPYTTQIERHPGIVIDGPLQGDWLAQCAVNWVGEFGSLQRFQYSNRRACYLGDTLVSGGQVIAVSVATGQVTVDLWVRNAAGEITSPGQATLQLHS